jgi:hypothetical protein
VPFDSQDYVNRFGGALAAAAQADRPDVGSDQGPGSADLEGPALGSYDPDQESNQARTQSGSKNVAPMPSAWQMFRGSPTPPGATKGGALNGGGADPSTGAPANLGVTDQSPDQSAQNVAHARSMEQLSDDDLKEYRDYINGHLGNTGLTHKDTGDKIDFDALYQHTFDKSLHDHAELANMTEAQASKFTNPTWRDKIGMFLDAQNRAGIIHSQNPTLSQGDIWAIATRNALQGWAQNAKGMHDAVVAQTGALQTQAKKDAEEAIKRQMDQAGYMDKISTARKANSDADKLDIDNKSEARLREAEINEKNASASDKRNAAAKSNKGDLVTVKNDDGSESTGYIDPKTNTFTPAKDASGKPVGGQVSKTGTDKPKPEVDDKLMTQAREAYEGERKAIRANLKNRKLTDQQVSQQALEQLKTASPVLYRAFTQTPDTAPTKKPGAPAGAQPPSWAQ